MSWDLDIRPAPEHFESALMWVLDKLTEGDSIDVHAEASPPWFHIVAAEGQVIAAEMRRRGVAVVPHVP